jgi:hypothetical protein
VLVVRVELWPFGDPRTLRQIALLGIVNVGPGPEGRHVYEARCEGRVVRLVHERAAGPLVLVARAIAALAEGSEPDPKASTSDEADFGLPPPSASHAAAGSRSGALRGINHRTSAS